MHLTCDEGADTIPFYVLPNRTGPFASVAFLASTFTYQAYANHARGNADAAYKARAAAWGASPYNPDDYPIYGRSTYNRHADNSGISISSRRRPILTMRPGFLTFDDPARLRPAALPRRHASAGLARSQRHRLRHHHR